MNEKNNNDQLEGCAICSEYDCFGPQMETPRGLKIRCLADKRGKGLTLVVKDHLDCKLLAAQM